MLHGVRLVKDRCATPIFPALRQSPPLALSGPAQLAPQAMLTAQSVDTEPDVQDVEIQCDSCVATLLSTDLDCTSCGRCRPARAARSALPGPLKMDSSEPASSSSTPPPADTDGDVDHGVEGHLARDWLGIPWHGGTLVPPPTPIDTVDATAITAEARVEMPERPPRRKKGPTGYQTWVRNNGQAIRRAMNGSGLKAFGAAAGRLWKALPQEERDTNTGRAAVGANATSASTGQTEQPRLQEAEPQPPTPAASPSFPSPAQLATIASNRAKAMVRKAVAAMQPPGPRRSTLDDSDGEPNLPDEEAEEQTAQPKPPSAAQERLEALRARVRARVAAASMRG